MKKEYLSPLSIELQLYPESLMVTISGEQSVAGVGGGNAGDEDPDLTRGMDFESQDNYWE